MNVKPTARGLLLCENAIVEQGTRNVSLINCFTKRIVDGFPSSPQRFVVFSPLIGGIGSFRMKLMITDISEEPPVFEESVSLTISDRLTEVRFIYRIGNCEFHYPAIYEVDLFADFELIASTQFRVALRGEQ